MISLLYEIKYTITNSIYQFFIIYLSVISLGGKAANYLSGNGVGARRATMQSRLDSDMELIKNQALDGTGWDTTFKALSSDAQKAALGAGVDENASAMWTDAKKPLHDYFQTAQTGINQMQTGWEKLGSVVKNFGKSLLSLGLDMLASFLISSFPFIVKWGDVLAFDQSAILIPKILLCDNKKKMRSQNAHRIRGHLDCTAFRDCLIRC